jgi:hypothetical protein
LATAQQTTKHKKASESHFQEIEVASPVQVGRLDIEHYWDRRLIVCMKVEDDTEKVETANDQI